MRRGSRPARAAAWAGQVSIARQAAAMNRHGRAAAEAAERGLRFGVRNPDGSVTLGEAHAAMLERAVRAYAAARSGESL